MDGIGQNAEIYKIGSQELHAEADAIKKESLDIIDSAIDVLKSKGSESKNLVKLKNKILNIDTNNIGDVGKVKKTLIKAYELSRPIVKESAGFEQKLDALKTKLDHLSEQVKANESANSQVSSVEVRGLEAASIAQSPFEDPTLLKFNTQIIALRGQIESMSHECEEIDKSWIAKSKLLYIDYFDDDAEFVDAKGEFDARKAEISKAKEGLIDEHTSLEEKKFDHVKKTYPHDMAYALAIPQTLPKGTILYTAGSAGKISGVLSKGILFDSSKPATGYNPIAKARANAPGAPQWGVNEMGDRGLYFSTGRPAYLSIEAPEAIGGELVNTVEGVSIRPAPTLHRQGIPEDQIDSAYDRLQREYQFIQHDALYPGNSEVVFMRNNQDIIITQMLRADAAHTDGAPVPLPAVIHSSWQKPLTMKTGHEPSGITDNIDNAEGIAA
ncbi:MAG: hypothetical protein Q8K75_02685 [Chlamydiales bacterium]|nr:hypothetical protein [Chlamydiales bacterium]